MERLTVEDVKKMFALALTCIEAKADDLSALDAVTGDGDHGTAILTAMRAINQSAQKGTEFKQMFSDMGFDVMMATSGSTSTLLGGLLLGMSDNSAGTELDLSGVKAMFRGGVEGVAKNTKAKVGDKTMMDALAPAVDAICANEMDIAEALSDGAQAALKGAEATFDMVATFGRARNYGERSRGVADAGATSWAIMFDAFSKAVK